MMKEPMLKSEKISRALLLIGVLVVIAVALIVNFGE